MKPKFEHDCDNCVFLETTEYNNQLFDLYVCPIRTSKEINTVVARYSDLGEDYISGVNIAKMSKTFQNQDTEILNKALNLAFEKGFTLCSL